jgi:2-methylcitrate dehydratase
MPDTLAERLAEYAISTRFDDLPEPVVHEAKRRLIDALACALGARHADAPQAAERVAPRVAAEQAASTFYGSRTSPDMAAFVNGILIRYLDFNDTYLSKEPAHPSDNLAAVLAAGEVSGSSGQGPARTSFRLPSSHTKSSAGWPTPGASGHRAGTTSATAPSRPRSEQESCSASTFPRSCTPRASPAWHTWQCARPAPASYRCGRERRCNGVLAAMLAAQGMTGPAPIFEGEMGFFAKVAHGAFDLPNLGGRNTAEYMLPKTYIKNWPAEYHAQSAIDAALQIREQIGGPAAIDRVLVETFNAAVEIIADPEKWRPKTRETADHSLPYCVAVALQDGEVGLDQFSERRIADPTLLDLVSRIEVRPDADLDARYPASTPNRITVTTRDGQEAVREVEFPKGHSSNAMTDDEVENKFRRLADGELAPDRQAEALRRLWALEVEADLRSLLALFRRGG